MLFYSSAKYPIEDDYSKFVADYGGNTNAFTTAESTNYQFDINWDSLEPGLDRFAQFFICPLISQVCSWSGVPQAFGPRALS